jgi:hypothetical protein
MKFEYTSDLAYYKKYRTEIIDDLWVLGICWWCGKKEDIDDNWLHDSIIPRQKTKFIYKQQIMCPSCYHGGRICIKCRDKEDNDNPWIGDERLCTSCWDYEHPEIKADARDAYDGPNESDWDYYNRKNV